VTPTEQKILQAIIYFVKHTKNCRKTKLFKLLYFLDFIHFKRHGTSVTGYDYIAMPRGPVPIKLFEQIKQDTLPESFKEAFAIIEEKDYDGDPLGFRILLKKKAKPDLDWLTPNEQKIMKEVAEIFRDSTATEMSEVTHLKNSPWDRTIKQKGPNTLVDYFLALDEETKLAKEEIEERFRIQRELQTDGRI
jgi:uncharacterized phage-associated protein